MNFFLNKAARASIRRYVQAHAAQDSADKMCTVCMPTLASFVLLPCFCCFTGEKRYKTLQNSVKTMALALFPYACGHNQDCNVKMTEWLNACVMRQRCFRKAS